jgi:hypothetical protein
MIGNFGIGISECGFILIVGYFFQDLGINWSSNKSPIRNPQSAIKKLGNWDFGMRIYFDFGLLLSRFRKELIIEQIPNPKSPIRNKKGFRTSST